LLALTRAMVWDPAVLVLEAGQVVEAGASEALIRRGGRFAALLELEAAGGDWYNDGRAGRP
jgi:ABC-type multidrug transport system fused ATPase/permease subunit